MENFEFCVPTKYIFGQGVVEQVGATVKSYGYKKVLLVYGGGSVIKSGLLDKIKSQLKDEDIDYYELGGVKPNPRADLVYEGIKICKEHDIEYYPGYTA